MAFQTTYSSMPAFTIVVGPGLLSVYIPCGWRKGRTVYPIAFYIVKEEVQLIVVHSIGSDCIKTALHISDWQERQSKDAADCLVYVDILAVLNLQPDFLYFPPYSLGPMNVTANDIYPRNCFPQLCPGCSFEVRHDCMYHCSSR